MKKKHFLLTLMIVFVLIVGCFQQKDEKGKEKNDKISEYYFALNNYRSDIYFIILKFDADLIGWGVTQDKYKIGDDIGNYLNSTDFIDTDKNIHKSYKKLNELTYIDDKCINSINSSYHNYQLLINLLNDFGDYSKERFLDKFNDLKSEINIDLRNIESHVKYLEKKVFN